MSNNPFPITAIQKRIKELKKMTPESLKETTPLYPLIQRSEVKVLDSHVVCFETIVRKRYNGQYFLFYYSKVGELEMETKTLHYLHREIYEDLMLRPHSPTDILDNDQENECIRLKKLNNE